MADKIFYIGSGKNADIEFLSLKDKKEIDKGNFAKVLGIEEDNILFTFLSNFYSNPMLDNDGLDMIFNSLKESGYHSFISNKTIKGYYGLIMDKHCDVNKYFESPIIFIIPRKNKSFYEKLLSL